MEKGKDVIVFTDFLSTKVAIEIEVTLETTGVLKSCAVYNGNVHLLINSDSNSDIIQFVLIINQFLAVPWNKRLSSTRVANQATFIIPSKEKFDIPMEKQSV